MGRDCEEGVPLARKAVEGGGPGRLSLIRAKSALACSQVCRGVSLSWENMEQRIGSACASWLGGGGPSMRGVRGKTGLHITERLRRLMDDTLRSRLCCEVLHLERGVGERWDEPDFPAFCLA